MNGKQLRNSILQWAISGRLVPQDPNDEPAIELLKRINPKAAPITEKLPFTIPDSWCWCRLGDIASKLGDGIHGTPEYDSNGEFYFVNGSNLSNGKIIIKSNTKRLNANEALKHQRLLDDTTVLVSINGTIGNIAFYRSEKIILGKSACFFNLRGNISKGFVKYLFETKFFIDYANEVATGSTIKNVPLEGMRNFTFPLPPLAEQERIVRKVEELLPLVERYDKAQTELNRLNASLKGKLRASVLQEAISGRLVPQDPNDEPAIALLKRINPKFTPQQTDEPLPTGWTACTMSMLCELTDGEKTKGKEMINLDAKYLRGQNEGNTLKEGRLIPANSLLILVDGENSGEVFRAPIEGYQGSTFKRLVINDNMYEPFVLQVINSHRTKLRKNKVGAAIPHLDKKLFKHLIVLVPPLAEQERIVQKVEELFAVLDALQ